MTHRVNRRDFLATTAAASVALTVADRAAGASFKTKLRKALIGSPDEATLTRWKQAGFEGMESNRWDVPPEEAAKGKETAERLGMSIHAVLWGWANFNSQDPEVVKADLGKVETGLKAAQAYGADALLLVPCRIDRKTVKMPEAREFDIEFDEKSGHVKKVTAGDNSQYKDYIAAHNHAIDTSRVAVEKLIPVAEKTRVVIALENVGNSLWVKPAIFKHFVASFANPWVKAYFDIANHVRYAPPQEWIRELGKLTVRCHVKDVKLTPDGRGGASIREGSVNWPQVRKALDEVGYSGWMTIEGSEKLSLEERSRRLDLIIAGK
jgi:L-ribulose-5-phosphate 3-epimerase